MSTKTGELQTGLEPHRIIRFLKSLGSKNNELNMQVFATSHSPTVLQELSSDQVLLVRQNVKETNILEIPMKAQGALRSSPASFLSKSVIICEGKTEIGFVRGIDLFRVNRKEKDSIDAAGTTLVDCGGGTPKRAIDKARVFQDLGYRVAVFIDNDKAIPEKSSKEFTDNGGELFHWNEGQSIEDAILSASPDNVIADILEAAENVNNSDPDLLYSKLSSESGGALNYKDAKNKAENEILTDQERQGISTAAGGKNGWFKDVARMEYLAETVIAPNFKSLEKSFKQTTKSLIDWAKK